MKKLSKHILDYKRPVPVTHFYISYLPLAHALERTAQVSCTVGLRMVSFQVLFMFVCLVLFGR